MLSRIAPPAAAAEAMGPANAAGGPEADPPAPRSVREGVGLDALGRVRGPVPFVALAQADGEAVPGPPRYVGPAAPRAVSEGVADHGQAAVVALGDDHHLAAVGRG